eukprot:scaffold6446_cov131-Skeletonema_marinoi.AAC.4
MESVCGRIAGVEAESGGAGFGCFALFDGRRRASSFHDERRRLDRDHRPKSAGGTSAPSASKRRQDDALNDRKRKVHRGNGNNGASIIGREIASPQTVLSVANNAAIPSAGNAPKGASGLAAQICAATTQLQKSKKKKGFPQGAAIILNEWLMSHLNNPYPSEQEKITLLEKAGIDKKQLCNWFTDARRRRTCCAGAKLEKKEQGQAAAAAAAAAARAAARLEKTKQFHFENITRLENRVNALEDNTTKQKVIALMGKERELLTKWSIETDLSGEAALAEKRRNEVWNEVFQIERQAEAAKKEQRQAKATAKAAAKAAAEAAEAAAKKEQRQAKAEAKAAAEAAKKEQRQAKAEAKAAAEKEQRQEEQARIEAWFPGIVHGDKTLCAFSRMTLFLKDAQRKILDQIIPLWKERDDDSTKSVETLLLSLKKDHREVELEHSIKYLRFSLHRSDPLVKMTTDKHLTAIATRVYRITQQTESVLMSGADAILQPPSKEDFFEIMMKITGDVKETQLQAENLYP